jgi:hypothetical protein
VSSAVAGLVTDLQAALGTGVQVAGGKRRLSENGPKRRVILVHKRGVIEFSSAPNRVEEGIPVGPTAPLADANYELTAIQRRVAEIEVTVRAADEDAVEDLSDQVLGHLFRICGANAFADSTPYEWNEGDGEGGAYLNRVPEQRFTVRVRFFVTPINDAITVPIDALEGDLFFGGTADPGPDEPVHIDTP